ncbi:hypothetical protein [Streptacidiphilus cavernicola]|uniref:Uncharacterized protein n=1 Tax=Streptacidiphilus cavernicola TaxID=3342716 RepID=A0ABV6VSH3_9ACTN
MSQPGRRQAGSFFGAKKANEPLHALYTQDNGTVALDNLGSATQSGLSVQAKVYSLAGAVLDDRTVSGLSLTGQQVRNAVITPKVPAAPSSPAQAYFVELTMRQGGATTNGGTARTVSFPETPGYNTVG